MKAVFQKSRKQIVPVAKGRPRRKAGAPPPAVTALADSETAGLIANPIRRALRGGAVRRELVNRIKAQIAEGSYETPEKIDIAIQRLLEDLKGR